MDPMGNGGGMCPFAAQKRRASQQVDPVISGWLDLHGSTENIWLVSIGESSRNVVGAKILFTVQVSSVDIQHFTDEHGRGKSHVVSVPIWPRQTDVFLKKNDTPSLFDLEEKFFLWSTKWKAQLMPGQELCVGEDSLLFTACKIRYGCLNHRFGSWNTSPW